jgi:hypothetical protein
MQKKSKIGPITVTRTHRRTGTPTGGYKSMGDAVMGPLRGNLSRVVMPKLRPKVSPAPKPKPYVLPKYPGAKFIK